MAKGWWEEDAYPLVWREGNLLVMQRDADLPQRCIRCNAPVEGSPIMIQLVWHREDIPRIPHIPLPIIDFVAAITTLAGRRTANIWVGLCDEHRREQRRANMRGAIGLLAIIAVGVAAVWLRQHWLWLLAIGVLVLTVKLAKKSGELVRVAKMDDKHIWLSGVAPEYLALLPQLREDGVAM